MQIKQIWRILILGDAKTIYTWVLLINIFTMGYWKTFFICGVCKIYCVFNIEMYKKTQGETILK